MENGKRIRVLAFKFSNELKSHQVPLFRGAVNACLGEGNNTLFHNHIDDSFRYSYPLIQYKSIDGKATIVCVNDGMDETSRILALNNQTINIGGKNATMILEKFDTQEAELTINDVFLRYKLNTWLPFNPENFNIYKNTTSLICKIELLQKILTGNILSMAKGLGIVLDDTLEVVITRLSDPKTVKHKGASLFAFDVEFITNTELPQYIGIGKGVSKGFGVVTHI